MNFFTKQSRKYISDRFQRFTKQGSSHRQSQQATTDHSTSAEGNSLLSPQRWGLPEDIIFRVSQGGSTSQKPCTFDELLGFLDSCGIDPKRDESRVAAIIAGIPFEIDGHSMRFDPIQINGASIGWAMNAHPLKQITIYLQGTRHTEVANMLKQLQEVTERISQGETQGESSDDDFGYKFSVNSRSNNPSIFDQSLTRNKQSIEEHEMNRQEFTADANDEQFQSSTSSPDSSLVMEALRTPPQLINPVGLIMALQNRIAILESELSEARNIAPELFTILMGLRARSIIPLYLGKQPRADILDDDFCHASLPPSDRLGVSNLIARHLWLLEDAPLSTEMKDALRDAAKMGGQRWDVS